MPSALFNLDLIHALHALHKRIDALEQVTQLHARVQHTQHIRTLAEINERIRYLQNEIRILTGLGRTMGKPNTTQIKRCEDELAELIEERHQRVY